MNNVLSVLRRCYSLKTAITMEHAGRLSKAVNLAQPIEAFPMDDTLMMMMDQYSFAVRDSTLRGEVELDPAIKRFDEFCYYAGPERELYTGTIMINCYHKIESPERLTPENLKLASILAWVYENITTGFVLTDDILDGHKVRWKKPAWHALPHVKQSSLLDIKQISIGSMLLLQKYFRNHPRYPQLQNLLTEFMHLTFLGQCLDYITSENYQQTRDCNLLGMKHYKSIVMYKTGFPLYIASPLGALHLANVDTEPFARSKHIFEKLAVYRQAQNDMWDSFSDFKNIGKHSSDIAKGKATWITATVLVEATETQRQLFLENYGREEPECQRVVRDVFGEMNIVERFGKFRHELMRECDEHTSMVAHPTVTKMINVLIEKYVNIYEDYEL
ncbi:hypothetical protein PPYR_15115 [Photinus pyralis]|uniref:Polyprenyl synthetase n=1 Tax=Photinus pyralis TaxID=7054 RepID=A0A5N3ZZL7_PHOPY|nr:farnesyl pyrophosphate synthase-like [Photinus pyralis]KAB0790489.1 hypothetical protein PPYR_15115 [Photinus pyralis]